MGMKIAPDVAQSIVKDIFRDLENVEVYIDDIAIFSNDWDSHVRIVEQVLHRLQDNGFTVNPLKCEWGVQETDWLGHWLTPVGLKPWTKKIAAIQQLAPPRTVKQL